MTVHLALDESPVRLPFETEAELLRIAQESVNNARKHSQADNLWVTCVVQPPNALLVGRGRRPRDAAATQGLVRSADHA